MNRINYEKLAQNHKKVSFIWYGRKIVGNAFDYDDPEDEEDGPVTLSLDNETTNSNIYEVYFIPDIKDLKVLD